MAPGGDPLSAVQHGIIAEKVGFDTYWVPDHFLGVAGERLDPWTVLSALAVQTRKIKLASGVTDTQRTHPARTAHVVAMLDVISNGRAILGIGAGEAMNIIPFGLPWEPARLRVDRLIEATQVIRTLWRSSSEKPVSFEGRFYKLKEAFLAQSPMQRPHPPIYIGAISSTRLLQAIGQYADGWYAWLNTKDTFLKRWSVIEGAARQAGRSPSDIESATQFMIAFTRNQVDRRRALHSAKVMLLLEKMVLASFVKKPRLSLEQYQYLLPGKDFSYANDAANMIPDEIVYRTAAIGGSEEIIEKVEEYSRAGVKQLTVAELIPPSNPRETLEAFAKIISRIGS